MQKSLLRENKTEDDADKPNGTKKNVKSDDSIINTYRCITEQGNSQVLNFTTVKF